MGFKILLLQLLVFAAMALPAAAQAPSVTDYVVGPQDVLTITSYDQADLSGKFTVEADGTFTYPMIGRVKAGGLTLRALEAALKKQLVDGGFFKNPQVTVSVETYLSQKIFIMGEVRQPGKYPLSGDMTLIEAIARAGTLPSSSGEAVIVHAGTKAAGPTLPTNEDAKDKDIVRVDLRELQNGTLSDNVNLRDGDTIFLPRAESIYVYGEVKNPNAYSLPQKTMTVLQALSLAGGLTTRGASGRIKIIRITNGQKKELAAKLTDLVQPGDTIMVPQRFF